MPINGVVVSLSVDRDHHFSKPTVERATFIAGVGIEGDAHSGVTVQHRSRLAKHADGPNLRQVHLVDTGLLDRLCMDGFDVGPGELGENVTLEGIDVSALGVGAIIELGEEVILAVTGRRNPCGQVNDLGTGLQRRLQEGHDGRVDGGAMAVVVHGGVVEIGAPVTVTAPTRHRPLQRV